MSSLEPVWSRKDRGPEASSPETARSRTVNRLTHPFGSIPEGALRIGVVPLAIFLVLVWTVFPFVFPYPNFDAIASLVMAGSAQAAAAVVSDWTLDERLRVVFWGGFDFIVDFAWWNGAALACIWAGRVFGSARMGAVAATLAWACWFGFLLNVPENLTFVLMTLGPVNDPWPALAAASAVLRLLILAAAVLFPTLAFFARLRQRRAH